MKVRRRVGQVSNLPSEGRQVENLPHGHTLALSSVADLDAVRPSAFNQLDRLSNSAEIVSH